MYSLEAGQPLNNGYYIIKNFADTIVKQTNINEVFNIEKILSKLGGQISEIDITNNNKFLEVYNRNNFKLYIPKGTDDNLKRLLLNQALGNYLIHSLSGQKPCYFEYSEKQLTYIEGFWFALNTTIPDEAFLKQDLKFSNLMLSHLYRVPVFAIEAKKNILNKLDLKKENYERK